MKKRIKKSTAIRSMKRSRTVKQKPKASMDLDIHRCRNCKEGRLIAHGSLVFCGFCGKEYPRTNL
ncbi:hypothetical protein ACFLQN_04705 [Candidatus Aenigmatarchaeota archaeon]